MPSLHVKSKTKIASPPVGSVSSQPQRCRHSEQPAHPHPGNRDSAAKGMGEGRDMPGMKLDSPATPLTGSVPRCACSASFLHFVPFLVSDTNISVVPLPLGHFPRTLCAANSPFHQSAFSPAAYPSSSLLLALSYVISSFI